MDVIINKRIQLTPNIVGLELIDKNGAELPTFSAGSHIDVFLENGMIRQYSLANCSSEKHRYLIGVLNDENSRGGSRFIHEHYKLGDTLKISEPRNLFPIHEQTQYAKLFAGGIGITPIVAMAHELSKKKLPFELHYFAKNKESLAFLDDLNSKFKGQIFFHLDNQADTQTGIHHILAAPHPDHHLYVCGPNGFMDFVIKNAQNFNWSNAQIHQEHFVAVSHETSNDDEFIIEIKSTGQNITVPKYQTTIQALEEHGISIPISCEQGICGTCLTNVVDGIPDHRDMFLTDEEHASNSMFTPCCSRAKTKKLVIDL